MRYLYYPGCSLKGTGKAYEESLLAVFEALGVPLEELTDWNCCGATAYMSVDELKAFALAARNLALAEQQGEGNSTVDLITPCSACYLVLMKAQHYLREYKPIGQKIAAALREAKLEYKGRIRLRHPLDVFVHDIGLETIANRVERPLTGVKVASYYGCQMIRPYATFDDQHEPTSMERLTQVLGAEPVEWPLKTRCCGGSLTGTVPEVGLRLSYTLLQEAQKRGADMVITACPLCQFNLECYQSSMRKQFGNNLELPVVYFTQLIGLAFGLPEQKIGLQRLFVPLRPALAARGGGSA